MSRINSVKTTRFPSISSQTEPPPGARRLTDEELTAFGPRLYSDAGMADFLTAAFGHDGWRYYGEPFDRWIVRDPSYKGEGRGFLIVERGGCWRRWVLPPVVQS